MNRIAYEYDDKCLFYSSFSSILHFPPLTRRNFAVVWLLSWNVVSFSVHLRILFPLPNILLLSFSLSQYILLHLVCWQSSTLRDEWGVGGLSRARWKIMLKFSPVCFAHYSSIYYDLYKHTLTRGSALCCAETTTTLSTGKVHEENRESEWNRPEDDEKCEEEEKRRFFIFHCFTSHALLPFASLSSSNSHPHNASSSSSSS